MYYNWIYIFMWKFWTYSKNTYIIVILLVIIIVVVGILSFRKSDYEYSYTQCETSDYTTQRNYINNLYWKGGDIVVKSDIELNCGENFRDTKMIIQNNTISLYIDGTSQDNLVAACDCYSHTTFKINKPQTQDYNVNLFLWNRKIDTIFLKRWWNIAKKLNQE